MVSGKYLCFISRKFDVDDMDFVNWRINKLDVGLIYLDKSMVMAHYPFLIYSRFSSKNPTL